jgi:hypothetical protein
MITSLLADIPKGDGPKHEHKRLRAGLSHAAQLVDEDRP